MKEDSAGETVRIRYVRVAVQIEVRQETSARARTHTWDAGETYANGAVMAASFAGIPRVSMLVCMYVCVPVCVCTSLSVHFLGMAYVFLNFSSAPLPSLPCFHTHTTDTHKYVGAAPSGTVRGARVACCHVTSASPGEGHHRAHRNTHQATCHTYT